VGFREEPKRSLKGKEEDSWSRTVVICEEHNGGGGKRKNLRKDRESKRMIEGTIRRGKSGAIGGTA